MAVIGLTNKELEKYYLQVTFLRDVPNSDTVAGDVGVALDYLTGPNNIEGFAVEVFREDEEGQSYTHAVVFVDPSYLYFESL